MLGLILPVDLQNRHDDRFALTKQVHEIKQKIGHPSQCDLSVFRRDLESARVYWVSRFSAKRETLPYAQPADYRPSSFAVGNMTDAMYWKVVTAMPVVANDRLQAHADGVTDPIAA
ncbi:MAG: hypothetical protein LC750_18715 [Actinobacteria bacterium]|nr:hypothetical protein [Actinomycetota bacterium]